MKELEWRGGAEGDSTLPHMEWGGAGWGQAQVGQGGGRGRGGPFSPVGEGGDWPSPGGAGWGLAGEWGGAGGGGKEWGPESGLDFTVLRSQPEPNAGDTEPSRHPGFINFYSVLL